MRTDGSDGERGRYTPAPMKTAAALMTFSLLFPACAGARKAELPDQIKPELVLVSAGFDAHAQDPIGSLGLEIEDFTALTKMLLDVARTHAKGRLVSCLEGGYNLDVLADSVRTHLEELIAAKA